MSDSASVTGAQQDSSQITPGQKKEDLKYNSHLEEIISAEAEKALVLRWLHDQSEKKYSQHNTFITIPVICISTLAGTASIGSESLFGGSDAAPVVIGMMSLIVSVLNVVSSFFGWAKRSEAHRICSINYGKLHRLIAMELALPRDQRVPAKHFLKDIRSQIDRLNETSPAIPDSVINAFSVRMKNLKSNVTLPEICNQINNVEVYKGKNDEEEPITNMIKNPMHMAKTSLLEVEKVDGEKEKEKGKEEMIKDFLAVDVKESVKGLVESGKNIYEDLGSNQKINEVIPKELLDMLKTKIGKF
jgi:hypothetical protein